MLLAKNAPNAKLLQVGDNFYLSKEGVAAVFPLLGKLSKVCFTASGASSDWSKLDNEFKEVLGRIPTLRALSTDMRTTTNDLVYLTQKLPYLTSLSLSESVNLNGLKIIVDGLPLLVSL